MDIKDLAGISEPIIKLIEVCSKGLGCIIEPNLIRKRADAKAYEIERVSNAVKDANTISLTSYANGKVKVSPNQTSSIENDISENQKKMTARINFQEMKKQKNINNTLNFTINELENKLKNETEVSDEQVDEDWITRFFNTIENISNEQLQRLWAKILAGEIKQPNTYSLRTLDILKNLSFKEAELLSKIGAFALTNNGGSFLLDDKCLLDKLNITFSELLQLQDLGLLHPNILQFSFKKVEEIPEAYLLHGKQFIKINRDATSPEILLEIHKFTTIGQDLLKLIDIPFNKTYIKEVANKVKIHESIKVLSCRFNDKGEYNKDELAEV